MALFGWGFVQRFFNNRNRALFRYWDGIKWRSADPLVILRGIAEHPQLTTDHLKLLENPKGIPQDIAIEAFDVVLLATRDVFGIQAWTESQPGLTQAETRDTLSRFMAFVGQLKKSGSPMPISPEPMEPSPSSVDLPVESTSVSSDSASISSEPIPADLPGCC